MPIALAADTLSIATMEIVDNAIMLAVPGAMDAGLTNVLLGMGVVLILWPLGDWEYAARPRRVIETYVEPDPLPLPLIHRDLAYHMDASYLLNRGHLQRLVYLFRACSMLLVAEILMWVVDLIANG